MKKIIIWIIVIGVLVTIKMVYFSKQNTTLNNLNSTKKTPTILTNFFVVKKTILNNNIYSTGSVGALKQIEVKSEVSGKIEEIYFKEGEYVKKGTKLFKLKDAELQALLLKLQTQLKLSQDKLERQKKLLEIDGISKEDYEAQESQVKSIKADILYQVALIEKTLIIAPFDGKLGLRNVSEGAYITPSTIITILVQMNPIFIEFSLPERFSSNIKNGNIVNFSLNNDVKENNYLAKIYAIEPKIEESTKSLKIRALYNGNAGFMMGSFVKVFVKINENNVAIMIPTQCLIPVLKGNKVFVVKNGIAIETEVFVGERTEDKIEILKGLNIGDTILSNGLLTVRKNSEINFLEEDF